MATYRMYHLNAAGEIKGPPFDLECTDDGHAVERALPYVRAGSRIEIWQAARHVRTLFEVGNNTE